MREGRLPAMTSSAIGKSTSCTSGTFLFEGTIKENFEAYYGVLREKPPYLDQMREALRRAALPISIETDCRSLSGGERQRAYLALFLSFSPDVLLLDEPTASL